MSRTIRSRRGRRRGRDRPGTPGAVFSSFGLLLPIGLVAGGIHCLTTEEFFLPIYRGDGFVVSGTVADGLGVLALGLAVLAHCAVFWTSFPALRAAGIRGMILGAAVMLAGPILAAL